MPSVFNAVLRIPAVLLVAATSAFAQSTGQSQTPVFRGGVDPVTVDMTVVDGDGRPILGLVPSDVTVMSADHRESSLPTFTRASTTDRLISTLTGGLAMSPTSGDTFFERFEREQAGGYVLAFEPASADRDGRAHEIRVTIENHPGATIRTRHEFAVPAPPPTVE